MKVINSFLFCSFFVIVGIGFANNNQSFEAGKSLVIENCLIDCYHIDYDTARAIASKFDTLLNTVKLHNVLDDFIEKSNELNIEFSANPHSSDLLSDDAVIKAPEWHEILFDSPYVRVLWSVTKPGEFEPFHTHQWRHLMLILEEARFKIEYSNGTIEIDTFPIGVYDLPPESTPSAYTNIGITDFRALIFEIKD